MKNKIFLGGTCANTTWRDKLIKVIQVDFFNPVVADWTDECQAIEIDEKENKCNIHFYLISKEMEGVCIKIFGIGLCWGYYSVYIGLGFNLPKNYKTFIIHDK